MSALFVVYLLSVIVLLFAVQFVFVELTAIVGRQVGATPTEIGVGFGPTLYRFRRNGIIYRLNPLPISAYTRFYGEDEAPPPIVGDRGDPRIPLEQVPAYGRLLMLGVGPLSCLLFGVCLVGIPIVARQPQLYRDSAGITDFVRSGVPGLKQAKRPDSWQGQVELLNGTVFDFFRAFAAPRTLKQWGGFGAALVTTATTAVSAWGHLFSCMGVLVLIMGIMNTVPFPGMNGFTACCTALELVLGRPLPHQPKTFLTYAGVYAILAFTFFVLYLDLKWFKQL